MNQNVKLHKMVQAALIAALYAAITLAVAPISFGQIQFRLSEALTILPLFTATAIPGLTLGCALANLLGFLLGINPVGLIDVPFGSAATLLAALVTYWIGKKIGRLGGRCALAPLPPVLFNAVIVGIELTILFIRPFSVGAFFLQAGSVLVGEFVVCYTLGILLILLLSQNQMYQKIFK